MKALLILLITILNLSSLVYAQEKTLTKEEVEIELEKLANEINKSFDFKEDRKNNPEIYEEFDKKMLKYKKSKSQEGNIYNQLVADNPNAPSDLSPNYYQSTPVWKNPFNIKMFFLFLGGVFLVVYFYIKNKQKHNNN